MKNPCGNCNLTYVAKGTVCHGCKKEKEMNKYISKGYSNGK